MAEFVKVIKELERMCTSTEPMCAGCELGKSFSDCRKLLAYNPAKVEQIVMKWSKAHRKKTIEI